MYKLVEGIIGENLISMTLAVNLLPEVERKVTCQLMEAIKPQICDGFGVNILYTNFMIRSLKYFKD